MANADGGAAKTAAGGQDDKKPEGFGLATVVVLCVVIGLLSAALVSLYYYDNFRVQPTPVTASSSQPAESETRFHVDVGEAGYAKEPNLIDEWRAARSDHKIIAYAVARCLGLNIDSLPEAVFSVLLLDLQPNGDHWWNRKDSRGDASTYSGQPLTSYESAMLAVSDEVARARLAASRGADEFYPDMLHFGWLAVIISAVATMLVTLKSSLGETTNKYVRAFSITVGLFAVAASTTATILTGAKQFWDPTNAYMRNETALLELRQLHTDIVLSFASNWDAATCQSTDPSGLDPHFARWRSTLVSLQSGTMNAPVIIATQNTRVDQPDVRDALPSTRSLPETLPPPAPPAAKPTGASVDHK